MPAVHAYGPRVETPLPRRRGAGHVEIRWSHGRFAQNPEAKVYLDAAHHDVPGYVRL